MLAHLIKKESASHTLPGNTWPDLPQRDQLGGGVLNYKMPWVDPKQGRMIEVRKIETPKSAVHPTPRLNYNGDMHTDPAKHTALNQMTELHMTDTKIQTQHVQKFESSCTERCNYFEGMINQHILHVTKHGLCAQQ